MKYLLKNVSIPWVGYVMFFVGIGFISGAVVHYPLDPSWFFMIGVVGAVLFVIGAIINEIYVLKKDIMKEGILGFVFFSLLLSLGIGMVSGGIQHFADIAERAVYLVPIGIVLSLVSFVFKSKVELNMKHVSALVIKGLVIAIPTYILLSYLAPRYAKNTTSDSSHHASPGGSSEEDVEMADDKERGTDTRPSGQHHQESGKMMDHQTMQVTDEKQFLLEMIPHHQDAIEASIKIISTTTDPKIEKVARDIMVAQDKEITQMNQWLKDWYGVEYNPSMSQYMSMMSESPAGETAAQKDQRFLRDMTAHHAMAIVMAEQVKPLTKRTEVLQLADDIIMTQSKEVEYFKTLITNP